MTNNKAIYDEAYQQLIAALITQRKSIAMTQEQLSELTGIPRYDISKVERLVRELRINELSLWLKAVGINKDLMGELVNGIRRYK